MKGRLGRIATLMIGLVLVVGTMGASFASFTDEFLVDASVETATVCWEVTGVTGTYAVKDMDTGGMLCMNEPPQAQNLLQVACSEMTAWDPSTNTLSLVFDNIFPCTAFTVAVTLCYCGTIPGHLTLDELSWSAGEELAQYMAIGASLNGGEASIAFEPGVQQVIQLHDGDCIDLTFTMLIPQDNALQAASGVFSTSFLVSQWCEGECPNGVQKAPELPDQSVHLTVANAHNTPDGYMDATFSTQAGEDPAPDWLLNGNVWQSWCCENEPSDVKSLPVMLRSSLEDEPYASDPAWNYVNYILNQPAYWSAPYDDYPDNTTIGVPGYTVYAGSPMQVAFWHFLFEGWDAPVAPDWDEAWVIINDALANGADFIPGSGQLAAVICEDGGSYQTVFIAVDP